jgi:hypothetical protein
MQKFMIYCLPAFLGSGSRIFDFTDDGVTAKASGVYSRGQPTRKEPRR